MIVKWQHLDISTFDITATQWREASRADAWTAPLVQLNCNRHNSAYKWSAPSWRFCARINSGSWFRAVTITKGPVTCSLSPIRASNPGFLLFENVDERFDSCCLLAVIEKWVVRTVMVHILVQYIMYIWDAAFGVWMGIHNLKSKKWGFWSTKLLLYASQQCVIHCIVKGSQWIPINCLPTVFQQP